MHNVRIYFLMTRPVITSMIVLTMEKIENIFVKKWCSKTIVDIQLEEPVNISEIMSLMIYINFIILLSICYYLQSYVNLLLSMAGMHLSVTAFWTHATLQVN